MIRNNGWEISTIIDRYVNFVTNEIFFLWFPEAFYLHVYITSKKKNSRTFPCCVFSSCLFMVLDASWGCWYSETKLMWQEQVIPVSHSFWDTCQIYSIHSTPSRLCEVSHNLPALWSSIISKFTSVTVLHHGRWLWSTA